MSMPTICGNFFILFLLLNKIKLLYWCENRRQNQQLRQQMRRNSDLDVGDVHHSQNVNDEELKKQNAELRTLVSPFPSFTAKISFLISKFSDITASWNSRESRWTFLSQNRRNATQICDKRQFRQQSSLKIDPVRTRKSLQKHHQAGTVLQRCRNYVLRTRDWRLRWEISMKILEFFQIWTK